MMKFFRGNERGAVTGYAISVIVLAVILVSGVVLLKNLDGNNTNTDKPVAVETGEFKADDAKTDETKAETKTETTPTTTTDKDRDETEATATPTKPETVVATGATEYMPEQLTATGPEDFLYVMIGLILAGGTFYLAWNYNKSRVTLRAKLLQK